MDEIITVFGEYKNSTIITDDIVYEARAYASSHKQLDNKKGFFNIKKYNGIGYDWIIIQFVELDKDD